MDVLMYLNKDRHLWAFIIVIKG